LKHVVWKYFNKLNWFINCLTLSFIESIKLWSTDIFTYKKKYYLSLTSCAKFEIIWIPNIPLTFHLFLWEILSRSVITYIYENLLILILPCKHTICWNCGHIWSIYFSSTFMMVSSSLMIFCHYCSGGKTENLEGGPKNLCRQYLDPCFLISPKCIFTNFQGHKSFPEIENSVSFKEIYELHSSTFINLSMFSIFG
jgi:hypothetical protein